MGAGAGVAVVAAAAAVVVVAVEVGVVGVGMGGKEMPKLDSDKEVHCGDWRRGKRDGAEEVVEAVANKTALLLLT